MKQNHLVLVSIIIINWNEKESLNQCLNSLQKIDYQNYEIILVDNGSIDSSVELVEKRYPKVKIVKNKTNLGYAEGNNIGYENAKGDLILFLNNDTIVERDFLDPLVDKIVSDSKIGAVQPKILVYSRKNIIDSVGSYLLPTGFLYHYGHNKTDEKKYNLGSEIFSAKGACMLFKREVLANVGVFDKDYFAYFEETDLCQRLWISGYKILYIPESKIYHKGGETAKKLDNVFIQYHSYRNRIYTYLKNFELINVLKIIPPHLALCEAASLAYFVTGKFPQAFAIQKAIFWNLANLRKILVARKRVARIRKIADSVFLPKIMRTVKINYYYHLFFSSLVGYKE